MLCDSLCSLQNPHFVSQERINSFGAVDKANRMRRYKGGGCGAAHSSIDTLEFLLPTAIWDVKQKGIE